MNKRDAHRLHQQLVVHASPDDEYAPVPTDEEFDQFKAKIGLPLPNSYRNFVLEFGPGELAGIFRIAVPNCRVPAFNLDREVAAHKKLFKGTMARLRLKKYDDPEQVQRMIVFSTTYRGESYCWDPEDITDKRGHEYAVYLLTRASRKPERIADSFGEFVSEYCLGSRFLDYFSDDTRSKSFSPAYLKKKS
jgi:hypothetical protein